MKRTQIYLDDTQDEQLAHRAATEGVTKSALIRRALEEYLDGENGEDLGLARFKAAVDAVAGSASELAQGASYVERLRSFDTARHETIERRRQA